MKIIYWNISKTSHPMYAMKKYEEELFNNVRKLRDDWEVERILRREGNILGSTVFSWLFYKSNDADLNQARNRGIRKARTDIVIVCDDIRFNKIFQIWYYQK